MRIPFSAHIHDIRIRRMFSEETDVILRDGMRFCELRAGGGTACGGARSPNQPRREGASGYRFSTKVLSF